MATRSFSPVERTSGQDEWSELGYWEAHISIKRQRKEVENLTPLIEFNLVKWLITATAAKIEK